MTLLPELALGYTLFMFGFGLGLRYARRTMEKAREARMRQLCADLRAEDAADKQAIAELCAILGPREVPE